ncbi:YecR family lipoprotein [Brenneria populi subsp. brevivirga]|uniref:YecR family lipoprotein n=1 Tax=Brenneria populi TaxID=1505588 RepID=UPI002E19FDE3|nr:YecR family lipoprotein [Brenneria populi subsp. brevivirga]
MKKYLLLFACVMGMSGCAVNKEMVPMGGSKADGTVRMGYTVAQFEKPVVNFNQAAELAAQKCKTWGYDGAEAFGGQVQQCTQFNAYGCVAANVSVEYQCTGGKAAEH